MLFLWSNGCWQFDLWFLCFSKSNLYIWKFLVHILLKPNLKDFEHYLASMWNECNYVVVSTFFGITLLEIGMKTDLFQSCGHCRIFQICWLIECSTFIASSFRIWNSSTSIPSPQISIKNKIFIFIKIYKIFIYSSAGIPSPYFISINFYWNQLYFNNFFKINCLATCYEIFYTWTLKKK